MEQNDDVVKNKDAAAFSYVWVMSVVVYLARHDSAFVRFHAKQAMILFILSIPIWFIPYLGRYIELLILGEAVLGFMAAAQGEWKQLPLVGRFVAKPSSDSATVSRASSFDRAQDDTVDPKTSL